MKVMHYRDIDPQKVEMEGVKGATIRWLIADKDGAPNFAMRLFEVEPGGHSPLHSHEGEHEVFILKGDGTVWKEGKEVPFTAGTAIFVPPNEKHQFINKGAGVMQFLCMIPV